MSSLYTTPLDDTRGFYNAIQAIEDYKTDIPAGIYYKEVKEDDEDVPVALSSLLRPKLNVREETPKEDLTGIQEAEIDLSDKYQLSKLSSIYPPSILIDEDPTYIYIDDDTKSFIKYPRVSSVSKFVDSSITIGHYWNGGDTVIDANQEITVPSKYRNRWVYYSCKVDYYKDWDDRYAVLSNGGFIPPNTVKFKVNNPKFQCLGDNSGVNELVVRFHEVTYTEVDYPELADAFASKGEVMDEWWKVLMFLSHSSYGRVGEYTFANLPSGEFYYKVVGNIYWHLEDDWFFKTNVQLKPKGDTTIKLYSGAGTTYDETLGLDPKLEDY